LKRRKSLPENVADLRVGRADGDVVGRQRRIDQATTVKIEHDQGSDLIAVDSGNHDVAHQWSTGGDEAGAHDQVVVDLDWTGAAGADEIHMGSWTQPFAQQDRLGRMADGADDVGLGDRLLGAGCSDDRQSELGAHPLVHRPWGTYRSIHNGDRVQVKHIMVKPGGQLSLQLHHHRAEHWVVAQGTAHVVRGEDALVLREDQSIYIPLDTKHRLENRGASPLHLIEVQTGSYLGEDDIVRFEDSYGRN